MKKIFLLLITICTLTFTNCIIENQNQQQNQLQNQQSVL